MVVSFADTSHFQAVDLPAYQAAGYDRIVIKATGGALDGTLRFVDSMFVARWRHAGTLGLARVAYHFARNNNSGADEFAWCWSQIHAAGGMTSQDVLCYDQEDNRTPQTTALARQRTKEFTAAAVNAGVATGWLYSGKWFLEPAGIVATDLPVGWRNLWISDYTPGQADAAIEVPAGWTRAHIVARQYADDAAYPGIPAPCDANRVIREWLTQGDDMTQEQFDALTNQVGALYRLLSVGDARDDAPGGDPGGHPWNLEKLRADVSSMRAALSGQLTAQAAAISALSALVSSGTNDLTAEEVEAAVATAIQEHLVHIAVTVEGQQVPAEPNV